MLTLWTLLTGLLALSGALKMPTMRQTLSMTSTDPNYEAHIGEMLRRGERLCMNRFVDLIIVRRSR